MSAVASTSRSQQFQQPPTPSYILRSHTAQISVLRFSTSGRWLYSGDVDGFVAVWDLNTFRPRWFWKAHEGGLLTIEQWESGLITHARDNTIRYTPLPATPISLGRAGASAVPSPRDSTPLEAKWEMGVNAMAYCRMSLFRLGLGARDKGKGKEEALVAVPSLTRDELIDIFHLPSQARVHRSVGAGLFIGEGNKTGTVMALKLFTPPLNSHSTALLHLLAGFEDGRVAHFCYTGSQRQAMEPPTVQREECEDWELMWEEKGHREAVMSLELAPDGLTAWSCAADHNICHYSLFSPFPSSSDSKSIPRISHLKQSSTDYPGRSALSIRSDGRLLAVAGWDGETRLYSTKHSTPLAVLSYHRTSLHALAFAPFPSSSSSSSPGDADSDSDEDEDEEDIDGAGRCEGRWRGARPWLAVGGKDERISLWEVYPS